MAFAIPFLVGIFILNHPLTAAELPRRIDAQAHSPRSHRGARMALCPPARRIFTHTLSNTCV